MLFFILFAHLAEPEAQKKILDNENSKNMEDIEITENEVALGKSAQNCIINNMDVIAETIDEHVSDSVLLGTEKINPTCIKGKEKKGNFLPYNEEEEEDKHLCMSTDLSDHKQAHMNCDKGWSEIERNIDSNDSIRKGELNIEKESTKIINEVHMSNEKIRENEAERMETNEEQLETSNKKVEILHNEKEKFENEIKEEKEKAKKRLEAKFETFEKEKKRCERKNWQIFSELLD